MMKKKVCILIPAYNEELVIEKTLRAVLKISKSTDIYVVSDGSIDKTVKLTKKYTKNVLAVTNGGKATAINSAISYFKLISRYEFILFMDADTCPNQKFLDYAIPHFADKSICCVVGRVQGLGGSWVSMFRLWEYELSHSVHKRAQGNLNSILVVPGCATVYRSDIFKTLIFPNGTLTEDMDFTFLLHRNGYSKMAFEEKSIVYTQDPRTLSEFTKQTLRWYTGFWQAVSKHDLPWHGQALDLEVIVLALEGLYNGLIIMFSLLLVPFLLLWGDVGIFKVPVLIDLFVLFIPSLLWVAFKYRKPKLLIYIFNFYFLRLLSSFLFLLSYFRAYTVKNEFYSWDTKRYEMKEVKI